MSSRHTKTIYLGGRTLVVQAAMMQGNDTFNIWSQCMSLTFFILFKRHDSKSETDRKSSYPLVQSPNTSMALTKAKQTWGARSLNPGVPHWWGGRDSEHLLSPTVHSSRKPEAQVQAGLEARNSDMGLWESKQDFNCCTNRVPSLFLRPMSRPFFSPLVRTMQHPPG